MPDRADSQNRVAHIVRRSVCPALRTLPMSPGQDETHDRQGNMRDQDIVTECAELIRSGLRMASAIHAVATANGMACADVQALVNDQIGYSVATRFALGVAA